MDYPALSPTGEIPAKFPGEIAYHLTGEIYPAKIRAVGENQRKSAGDLPLTIVKKYRIITM